MIKEILPLSKANRKPRVRCDNILNMDLFYKSGHRDNNSDEIPPETVLYDKIKVLEKGTIISDVDVKSRK